MQTDDRGTNLRIIIIGFFLAAALALITARAYFIQISLADTWRARATRQHERTLTYKPHRGVIYDRNGYEMAISTEVASVAINAHKSTPTKSEIQSIANALEFSDEKIEAIVAKKPWFAWLRRHVPPDVRDKVAELNLPNIQIVPEQKRYYPAGPVASHLIGFTGVDPKGLEGIEKAYDQKLMGASNKLSAERDGKGRLGIDSYNGDLYEKTHGNSLHLTIDSTIQYIAEMELEAGVKAANAKAGIVVIMDPSNGDILAMANYPSFNPNSISKHSANEWRNRAVTDMYEPGSTLKPLVMAAALNEKVITSSTLIDCENGSYYIGGRTIRDHKKYSFITAAQALVHSSNIGFAKIGEKLGKDNLYNYLYKLGFGERTKVNIPGEAVGILRPLPTWYEADLANISFGQGVSVTAIQLAKAFAILANHGRSIEPRIITQLTDPTGSTVSTNPVVTGTQVFSSEVADEVVNLMVGVTGPDGTAPKAAVEGYRIAGKTGTAQKFDPNTGTYSVDKRLASFIGIAPAENPKYVVVTMIDEPEGVSYGGVVAAPVFSNIARQILTISLKVPTEESIDNGAEPDAELWSESPLHTFTRGISFVAKTFSSRVLRVFATLHQERDLAI